MTPDARLSNEQLAAVSETVKAVVGHDEARIAPLVAGGDHDIYLWTRSYGNYGQVDLVLPPGQRADWDIDAIDVAGDPPTVSVQLPMFTKQEGRSDLTLELTLELDPGGHWSVRIDGLHVL